MFNHAKVLSNLDFKSKNIVLPEGCTIIESVYPLEKIWRAHQSNEINQNEYVLNIECGEYYWWIGLVENELLVQPLSKSAWFFLNEVKNKGLCATLEQLLAVNHHINPTQDLVDLLRKGQLILL